MRARRADVGDAASPRTPDFPDAAPLVRDAAPSAASAPSVMPRTPDAFVAMRWPPCEMAGRWAYCQAAGGTVYRTTLGTVDTKQIATGRPSTRIAAAALGPHHAVVATLDIRRTTEGDRLQAFVTLDDGETTRLSDEGAGAPVLHLLSRGGHAVALYPTPPRACSTQGRSATLSRRPQHTDERRADRRERTTPPRGKTTFLATCAAGVRRRAGQSTIHVLCEIALRTKTVDRGAGIRWPLLKLAKRVTSVIEPSQMILSTFHRELRVEKPHDEVLTFVKELGRLAQWRA